MCVSYIIFFLIFLSILLSHLLFRPVPPCSAFVHGMSAEVFTGFTSSKFSDFKSWQPCWTQTTDPVAGPGKRDLRDPDPVDDLWVEPVPRCAEIDVPFAKPLVNVFTSISKWCKGCKISKFPFLCKVGNFQLRSVWVVSIQHTQVRGLSIKPLLVSCFLVSCLSHFPFLILNWMKCSSHTQLEFVKHILAEFVQEFNVNITFFALTALLVNSCLNILYFDTEEAALAQTFQKHQKSVLRNWNFRPKTDQWNTLAFEHHWTSLNKIYGPKECIWLTQLIGFLPLRKHSKLL